MVDTIEQWFETLFFLDKHGTNAFPSNLMILTNAGGPGVNSVDLASKSGLNLAKWHHHSRCRSSVRSACDIQRIRERHRCLE
jgi:acyl-CoA synthetase (NDP forming)